jgi:hypothetical protein
MPVIHPQVPNDETRASQRIIRKFLEYMAVYQSANADPVQLQGERYEIAVAIALFNKGLLTHGNQISRWTRAAIPQHVSVGANTEYDMVIPQSQLIPRINAATGPILVEAKSYANGLGQYYKKAIGYCLNDPTLGGFCFVTPGGDYTTFMEMIEAAISIMGGNEDTPAITGGQAWKTIMVRGGKPSGPAIVQYYRHKYFNHPRYAAPNPTNKLQVLQNDHVGDVTGQIRTTTFGQAPDIYVRATHYRTARNQRMTAAYYDDELALQAGFVMASFTVPTMTHDQIRDAVGLLPPW